MTPLRKRMIAARQLRGMSERTQELSGRAVHPLADYTHQSSDQITAEALRQSFISRKNV